jgi:16S rRNA (cytosine1402-N4)-methyltransferase
MARELARAGITQVDGVLLDLGVSSPQIDTPARGFSFRFDAPLDMRMDTTRGETAADFLARADERDIAQVIKTMAKNGLLGPIAKALVARREGGTPVRTTGELAALVARASRPASRARTLQRARFKAFGFTSTPSLKRSSRG